MSYHGFMMNYHDGVIVLCAMILAPREICAEAAWYRYKNGIPFSKHIHRHDWLTKEVYDDIVDMRKRIPQCQIAEFYCLDAGQFSRLFRELKKKYKEA